MTAEDIKAYCLSKHKACEAYPFGKVPVCYKLNDKIFAQLYPDEGNYKITLKCTADAAQFYRMVYPDKSWRDIIVRRFRNLTGIRSIWMISRRRNFII